MTRMFDPIELKPGASSAVADCEYVTDARAPDPE